MGEVDLERVRYRHKTIKNFNGRKVCYWDNDKPPCDAIQLVEEVERLREAMKEAHRALLGGSIKPLVNQAVKACNILHAALHTEEEVRGG